MDGKVYSKSLRGPQSSHHGVICVDKTEVLQNEPRATLRWKVAPDRWAQQDRPFRFDLVGEAGLRLPLAVRYPNTLPKAAEVVLQVLRGTLPI